MGKAKIITYMSHFPEIGMESISYVNRRRTFHGISSININPNRKKSFLSISRHNIFPFKYKQDSLTIQSSILNKIFVPPGFSYLFSYNMDLTCDLTEHLSKNGSLIKDNYIFTKRVSNVKCKYYYETEFGFSTDKLGRDCCRF